MLAGCSGTGSKTTTTVEPVVTVAISPKSSTLMVNAAETFTATVTSNVASTVTWSVKETNGGSVDSTGKYTAAAKAGTYHVVVTSTALATATDTATVTVTAPAPTITSSAPTAALQDNLYSYSPTATDPDGLNDVTFTLTTAPANATVSGGTIIWTPTAAESRLPNAFTMTATTPAGGTATQSWTVNPNGTIYGSYIDTYWNQAGTTAQSINDLSGSAFSALVPNGDGTFTTIAGSGGSGGTFTIPGVPSGYYWLVYNYDSYYWTNSSTFDLGADYSGRNMSPAPPAVAPLCDSTASLGLTLTGLDSLDYDSSIYVSVPNQNGEFPTSDTVSSGSTTYSGTLSLACPVVPASGDVAYAFQWEDIETVLAPGFSDDGGYPGPSMSLGSLQILGESFTPAPAGTPTDVNPQSVDFAVQEAAWTAAFNNVGPAGAGADIPTYGEFDVDVQPIVTDRAASPQAYLAGVFTQDTFSSNVDNGLVTFNDPYPPTWPLLFYGYADALDSSAGLWLANTYYTTTQPSGFAPLMSGVQNPSMNGIGGDFFTPDATTVANSVTLSWAAPTGLTPAGYEISFTCVDSSCPIGYGEVYTASNSVTLPTDILPAGYHYVFEIGANANSLANYNSSPYRSGYPNAYANVVSAPLFFNPSTSGVAKKQIAAARVVNKNIVRNKYGTFLVTPKGNKPLDIKARMLAPAYQRSIARAAKAAKVVPPLK
jgi:hypothetical protein